jgi:hypothetical protein
MRRPFAFLPLATLLLAGVAHAEPSGLSLPNILQSGRVQPIDAVTFAQSDIPDAKAIPVYDDGTQIPADQNLPGEGPEAALALEKSQRGDETNEKARRRMSYRMDKSKNFLPAANPIMLEGLQNIVPLTPTLWDMQHVIEDFEANSNGEQKGIVVFLKTEFCHRNAGRLCSVTTAALEKRSTPLLRQFRVYGAWIKELALEHIAPEDVPKIVTWHDNLINTYGFKQGPGARVVVLVKRADGQWVQAASNAQELGLYISEFEANGGKTPGLENLLQSALTEQAGLQNVSPHSLEKTPEREDGTQPTVIDTILDFIF